MFYRRFNSYNPMSDIPIPSYQAIIFGNLRTAPAEDVDLLAIYDDV